MYMVGLDAASFAELVKQESKQASKPALKPAPEPEKMLSKKVGYLHLAMLLRLSKGMCNSDKGRCTAVKARSAVQVMQSLRPP